MKKSFLLLGLLTSISFSQVGIGTTTPSNSAMLEISSTSNAGVTYRGFMPPRVPTIPDRDNINPVIADMGLTVFVDDTACFYMWNGTGWEDVHCLNNIEFSNVVQNFDLGSSWGYTSDVPFFDNGTDGFYGVTDASNGGFVNITSLTNNFLGILDLDDEGTNGTAGFATITFATINVSSALGGVTLEFDYEFYEFDAGDDAFYTVIIDGIDQPEVQLINGTADLSISGTVVESIPGGTASLGLRLRFSQNGIDYAGFDNFRIYE